MEGKEQAKIHRESENDTVEQQIAGMVHRFIFERYITPTLEVIPILDAQEMAIVFDPMQLTHFIYYRIKLALNKNPQNDPIMTVSNNIAEWVRELYEQTYPAANLEKS